MGTRDHCGLILTAAHSTLLPGASQLVPVLVYTPALARAAVALRGFVVALLVTVGYECSWGIREGETLRGTAG